MELFTELEKQLTRDEGMRLTPYKDTTGHLTIGIGRNLDAKGISAEEARLLLRHDIQEALTDLTRALPWTRDLDAPRLGVLINMAFNMGLGGLLTFTKALAAVRAGFYREAAREMLDSTWAGQVGDRAARLARQMETGEWQ